MADSSDNSLSADWHYRHYDRLLSEPWYSSCDEAACWTHFVSPSHPSLHILLLNSVLIPLTTPSDLIHELVKTRMSRLQAEVKGFDRLLNKMSKNVFSPYLLQKWDTCISWHRMSQGCVAIIQFSLMHRDASMVTDLISFLDLSELAFIFLHKKSKAHVLISQWSHSH